MDRRGVEHGGPAEPQHEENGSVLPGAGGRGPTGESPGPSPLLVEYDASVLPVVEGLGPYPRRLVLLTWIPALFIGFSQFSDSFLLDQPDFWCLGTRDNSTAAGHRLITPAIMPSLLPDLHNHSIPQSRGLQEHPAHAGDHQLGEDCEWQEWSYQIRAGLGQNVVSKGYFKDLSGAGLPFYRKLLDQDAVPTVQIKLVSKDDLLLSAVVQWLYMISSSL